MKNVGLVTWYRGTNYGSTLQAYATRIALERLSARVRFVRSFERPFNLHNTRVNLFSRLRIRRVSPLATCPFPAERQAFASFLKQQFPEVLPVSSCGYRRMLSSTDLFLCGSDQIWNCRHGFNPFLFLDFAGSARKASYSSSIGTGDVPSEYREQVKKLLKDFTHIGVREESTRKALAEVTGREDICTVLDPVFLLTAKDWTELLEAQRTTAAPSKPYVFCYFVGKASLHAEHLAKIKEATGLEDALLLPSNDTPLETLSGATRVESAGPMEFLRLLSGASAVLTDSFHGSALSIVFGRQFFNVKRFSDSDPASQNSRLYDLCKLFSIDNRFLEDGMPGAIDYTAVSARLEDLRAQSISFLKELLR